MKLKLKFLEIQRKLRGEVREMAGARGMRKFTGRALIVLPPSSRPLRSGCAREDSSAHEKSTNLGGGMRFGKLKQGTSKETNFENHRKISYANDFLR